MTLRAREEIEAKVGEWDSRWSGLPGGNSRDDFVQGVVTALAWALGAAWDEDFMAPPAPIDKPWRRGFTGVNEK